MKLMADAQGTGGGGGEGQAPEAGDQIAAQVQGMGTQQPPRRKSISTTQTGLTIMPNKYTHSKAPNAFNKNALTNA